MKIKCPNCGELDQTPDSALYERARCDACGSLFFAKDAIVFEKCANAPDPSSTTGEPQTSEAVWSKIFHSAIRIATQPIEPSPLVDLTKWGAIAAGVVLTFWVFDLSWHWVLLLPCVLILMSIDWDGVIESRALSRETERVVKLSQNAKIVCPQCGERGHVQTEQVKLKKGISGGKTTGVILTGGISLLVTGLSREEDATKATCSNCGSTWHFQ